MKKNNSKLIALFAVLIGFSQLVYGSEERLVSIVDKIYQQQSSQRTGYSLYVFDGEQQYGYAIGNKQDHGEKLQPHHVFRIASITKTFTAAAILRLSEQDKLSLDAAISELISTEYDTLLQSDGYKTEEITVRHLLSHTAGLFDHAQSPKYFESILDNPSKTWTRAEQLASCVEWGEPLSAPGEAFSYSDTGYILLGHIIERITTKVLPVAVRELLRLDETAINVVWETGDSKSHKEQLRVHQIFNGLDTFYWNPTLDLHGGGGLVASPRGVAQFFSNLFENRVFDKPSTLKQMLSSRGLPEASPYRLGVFDKTIRGHRVYEHSGFWGMSVMVHAGTSTVIAGASVVQEDYPHLITIMESFLMGESG